MRLSVIISCYNKESSIINTIQSVIDQTIFNELEVIIVDDCSTDNSYYIVKDFIKTHPNIKLFRHDRNKSVFVARQTGIRNSSSEYVTFLDSDDWIYPNYYKELLQELDKYSSTNVSVVENVSVVRFKGDVFSDARPVYFSNHVLGLIPISPYNKFFVNILTKDWNLLWNKLIKRDLLDVVIQLPEYYINFMEDIAIVWLVYLWSYLKYSRNSFVLITSTQEPFCYNLSEDISHLSVDIDRNERQEYIKKVFIIVPGFITNNHLEEWKEIWDKYKKHYISIFTRDSNQLFGIERFQCQSNIETFIECFMNGLD